MGLFDKTHASPLKKKKRHSHLLQGFCLFIFHPYTLRVMKKIVFIQLYKSASFETLFYLFATRRESF